MSRSSNRGTTAREAMRENGLRLHRGKQYVLARPRLIAPSEVEGPVGALALIAVKCGQTAEALRLVADTSSITMVWCVTSKTGSNSTGWSRASANTAVSERS